MKNDLLITTFLVGLIICGAAKSRAETCSNTDAMAAESEASSLITWEQVYSSYLRFHQCDDGAISEGYSSTIGNLLATDWGGFDQLQKIANSDQNFRSFVLRHIDDTVTMSDLVKIKDNAENHCPLHSEIFCKQIYSAASD